MSTNLAAIGYLVAAICFILALRGLSSPATSRQGNRLGMIGMTIAIVVTLLALPQASPLTYLLILVALGIDRQEHVVAGGRPHAADLARHRRLERIDDPTDHHADRVGAGARERPGVEVGVVVELGRVHAARQRRDQAGGSTRSTRASRAAPARIREPRVTAPSSTSKLPAWRSTAGAPGTATPSRR